MSKLINILNNNKICTTDSRLNYNVFPLNTGNGLSVLAESITGSIEVQTIINYSPTIGDTFECNGFFLFPRREY